MRKRKWVALGALGTVVGMAVKLVRGRREEVAPTRGADPAPVADASDATGSGQGT